MRHSALALVLACTAALPAAEAAWLARRFRHAHQLAAAAVRHLGAFETAAGDDPLNLLVLGESIAAGLFVERFEQTLGGLVAAALAAERGRPVHCLNLARPGATCHDLLRQLPERLQADVALVVVGANDVARRTPLARFEAELDRTLAALDGVGEILLFGPCDISGVPLFPFWLRRMVAYRMRHYIARMERVVARHANVSYAWLPPSAGLPASFFAADRFHPNAEAHRRLAERMLAGRARPLAI
ncbi:MAG: GDSL-type esterase/lipase family protein [Gaiellaceae bacterium]